MGLGGQTPSPRENNKAKGFFRNTGPDTLEYLKATQTAFNKVANHVVSMIGFTDFLNH